MKLVVQGFTSSFYGASRSKAIDFNSAELFLYGTSRNKVTGFIVSLEQVETKSLVS